MRIFRFPSRIISPKRNAPNVAWGSHSKTELAPRSSPKFKTFFGPVTAHQAAPAMITNSRKSIRKSVIDKTAHFNRLVTKYLRAREESRWRLVFLQDKVHVIRTSGPGPSDNGAKSCPASCRSLGSNLLM